MLVFLGELRNGSVEYLVSDILNLAFINLMLSHQIFFHSMNLDLLSFEVAVQNDFLVFYSFDFLMNPLDICIHIYFLLLMLTH